MDNSLVNKTRSLLLKDQRPLLEIANGADVGYHWLVAFKRGRAANASVTLVQRLYEFLAGKSLKV